MQRLAFLGILLLGVGLLAGCAQRGSCLRGACSDRPGDWGNGDFPDRIQERGIITADVSAFGPLESHLPADDNPLQYRFIEAIECQCSAASEAPLANLITMESDLVQATSGRRRSQRRAAEVQSDLLAFRGVDERNRAAGEALNLFYLLAEAEYNRDSIARSLAKIREVRKGVAKLKAARVDVRIDENDLSRQESELREKKAELLLSIEKLNGRLRHLLGLCVDDLTPIWPVTDLRVVPQNVDVQQAVAVGLSQRADLQAIQMVTDNLDRSTLPAARSALRRMDALLGMSNSRFSALGLLLGRESDAELPVRQKQLSRLLVDLKRTASEEISAAANTVNTRLVQVALAKETLGGWQQQLEGMERLQKVDGTASLQFSEVKLKLIQAENELIHQVVAWEIARVRLKQSQGLLAAECGYTCPCTECTTDCEDCCCCCRDAPNCCECECGTCPDSPVDVPEDAPEESPMLPLPPTPAGDGLPELR